MKPLVSVIIPVYNSADTIRFVVEAAARQTYPESRVEIIVVDNNSTDGTKEALAGLSVQYVFEARRNRSRARNVGAAHASGDFLAFLDADCVVPVNWLESLVQSLDAHWLGAAQARVQRRGEPMPSREFRAGHYFLPYLDSCTLLVRRSAFDAATGFNEELNRAVDMDFSFRVLSCGFGFAWVPDTVVIKHHDLSPRQAGRRGWVGGQNMFLLDRAWDHRVRRSGPRLFWDRLKFGARTVATEVAHNRRLAAVTVAEQSSKLVSYAIAVVRGRGVQVVSLPVVGSVPRVLGHDKYIVVDGEAVLVFDALARSVISLSPPQSQVLRYLLDTRVAVPHDIDAITEATSLSVDDARLGLAKVERLLGGVETTV